METKFSIESSELVHAVTDQPKQEVGEGQMTARVARREGISAEEELFLDCDMLISTISGAWAMLHGIDQGDPDIREREHDGTYTPYGVIQQHNARFLKGWAELLYSGAVNSVGSARMRYATALERLRLMVGCDNFRHGTKELRISEVAIKELVKKAQEEIGPNSFAHRFI